MIEPAVGEGMHEQRLEHRRGDGHRIGADLSALHKVDRIANAGGQQSALDVVVVEEQAGVAHSRETVMTGVLGLPTDGLTYDAPAFAASSA